MRAVTPEIDVHFDRNLKAGVTYVIHDRDAGPMISKVGGLASMEACELPAYDKNEDYNGKTLTILKDGMVGDIFLLGPIVDAIKKRWPDVILEICCRMKTEIAVPPVCLHLPYPAEHSVLLSRDAVLNLCDSKLLGFSV